MDWLSFSGVRVSVVKRRLRSRINQGGGKKKKKKNARRRWENVGAAENGRESLMQITGPSGTLNDSTRMEKPFY